MLQDLRIECRPEFEDIDKLQYNLLSWSNKIHSEVSSCSMWTDLHGETNTGIFATFLWKRAEKWLNILYFTMIIIKNRTLVYVHEEKEKE
jgi:hypothetical protein